MCHKEWREKNAERLRESSKQRYIKNRDKVLARTSAYNKKHRDRLRVVSSYGHKRRKYGLTKEAYDDMLHKQSGLCPICGIDLMELGPKKRHTDHDHNTGVVRGILCAQCNVGLGNFKDTAALLRSAAEYIEEHHGHA
jgi:hypothetical protein